MSVDIPVTDIVIINSLGDELPTPIRVLIDCEVPGCMKYTHQYYTTCEAHTDLLLRAGIPLKFSKQAAWVYNSPIPLGDTVFDFRFSASYASRYNNCHGSANLEEAIPGFEHPERNDNGMKGEGTKLHKIFAVACENPDRLREAGVLLREVAEYWGPERTAYLKQSEVSYITSWYVRHKTAPPLELSTLQEGLLEKKLVLKPDKTPKLSEDGQFIYAETGGTPRRIVHLADALDYVADIWETLDPETREIFVEVKVEAKWLETEPKTTVDLIMRDHTIMHTLDLKMGDIVVSPIRNEQLMYYSQTFRRPEDTNIRLHIIQRNHTDFWDLPIAVLDKWVEQVRESEQAILAGDLTLTTGNHCKFCPANPHARGDKGNKACPLMLTELYGVRDAKQSDEDVTNDGDDYND